MSDEASSPDEAPVPHAKIDPTVAHSAPMTLRDPEELAGFLEGLEVLSPGVVSCSRWRPEPGDFDAQHEVSQFCAVARKP
ncbi:SAM-dependent methyltransferase [Sphaerisporangium sp. NPDC004334]